MRALIFCFCLCLLPAGCAGVPAMPSLPTFPGLGTESREPADRPPFNPRDVYPTPPNVGRLIGPEDCRGSTLAAVEARIPDYPVPAYANGRQGWVVVRFHVYADGSVHRSQVARSVPSGVFDRVATRAVADWRFRPLEGVDSLENCVVMFEFRSGRVRIR